MVHPFQSVGKFYGFFGGRGYTIPLKDPFHYPSAEEISEAIISYFTEKKLEIKIADQNGTAVFLVGGEIYRPTVFSNRTGYHLSLGKCPQQ